MTHDVIISGTVYGSKEGGEGNRKVYVLIEITSYKFLRCGNIILGGPGYLLGSHFSLRTIYISIMSNVYYKSVIIK
jgi:hypothetical protein